MNCNCKIKKWGKILVIYFIREMERKETEKYLRSLMDREGDILEIIISEFQKPEKSLKEIKSKKENKENKEKNDIIKNEFFNENIKNKEDTRNTKVNIYFTYSVNISLITIHERLYEIL